MKCIACDGADDDCHVCDGIGSFEIFMTDDGENVRLPMPIELKAIEIGMAQTFFGEKG